MVILESRVFSNSAIVGRRPMAIVDGLGFYFMIKSYLVGILCVSFGLCPLGFGFLVKVGV